MATPVVFGFLGTTLNQGRGPMRWEYWRPTVALCRQPDFIVKRLELIHTPPHTALARLIADDIASISSDTEVRLHAVDNPNP